VSTVAVVVPTIGRPSLRELFTSLADAAGAPLDELIVVDDRHVPASRLTVGETSAFARRVVVLHSNGRGPARARNVGWRDAMSDWICFLDDDVVVSPDWIASLQHDLALDPAVEGSQGIVTVPLPCDRPPSDWERNVAGLAQSRWITADMAYRRAALERVGGFDERFPRAYREDADLALRVQRSGGRLVRGSRRTLHPVRPADRWISIRLQRGNADDVLMRALHGPRWRAACGAGPGRLATHVATVGCSLLAFVALASGAIRIALLAFSIWGALIGAFAYARIAPGPRTRDEVVTMLLTSIAIPYAAIYHRMLGMARLPGLLWGAA
jgi:glycosyltransferase involved in cell wall biosynthesis